MTDKEKIAVLKETNAFLLSELAKLAKESIQRDLAITRLVCEVEALAIRHVKNKAQS